MATTDVAAQGARGVLAEGLSASVEKLDLNPDRAYTLTNLGKDSAGADTTGYVVLSEGADPTVSLAAGTNKIVLIPRVPITIGPGIGKDLRFQASVASVMFQVGPHPSALGNW
ncbi:MAG: hypothetical protein IT348_19415 [Candidatus Eisenbacteria bacterium]|nr:hypothetical protein [Candidatus Eisenbacteria bacterium]